MAQDSYLGILKQFGLELPDEQYARQLTREKRIADAMSMGGISEEATANPITGTFGRLGATVGDALAKRSNPNAVPSLPPELQQRYDLVNKAKTDFQSYRVDHPEATEEELEDAYQKILIRSAYTVGLPDMGTTMLGTFKQQRMARDAAKIELEKLGYERDVAKADVDILPETKEQKLWKMATDRQSDLYSVDGTPLGNWRIDKDGNAVDATGRVMYQLGEYRTVAPTRATGGSGPTGNDLPITKSRVAELQKIQLGARDMMFVSHRLGDIMDAATRRDPNGQVLGWGGDVARAVTNIADNVTGAMSSIGKLFGADGNTVEVIIPGQFDKDGKPRAVNARTQQQELIKEYEGEITAVLSSLPQDFRELGIDATRAKTTLMSLAYAIMRAEEPGNSRYSDDDFKRALQLAGEGLADPNKLKATLWDRLAQYHNQYSMAREQIPEEYHNMIWGPKSHESYQKEYAAFETRFAPKTRGTSGAAPRNTGAASGWRVVRPSN